MEFGYFNDFWAAHRHEFDALFFDIDGTLISGRHRLPGAQELLTELRLAEFPFLLLTNDANHSLPEKCELVRNCGLEMTVEHIVSSASPLAAWVKEHNLSGQKFFLMGDLGKPCYAVAAGLQVTKDVKELDSCIGVLVGENYYDWYWVMYEVFNFFLRHPHSYLISPNPDICWAGGRGGGLGLGAGAVAEALQLWLKHQSVDITPVFLGKPYKEIYHYAMRKLNLTHPERILMLGDSLRSDMAGAQKIGIKSGLLLSGITSKKMLQNTPSENWPDFCFEGLLASSPASTN